MKILKIAGSIFIVFLITMVAAFFLSSSFVNDLDIAYPEPADFIHPSKGLVRWEVFVSGVLFRPVYAGYVNGLNLSGDEKILNFGSGAGGEAIHLADAISEGKGSLTCVDISDSWLKVVEARLKGKDRVDFMLGDIRTMVIPAESYDAIVIRLVLHDIPGSDRKGVVAALYRLLKKGGTLYALEPLSSGHSMEEKEMRSLFKEAGFTERSFRRSFSLVMVPPRYMGEAVYGK